MKTRKDNHVRDPALDSSSEGWSEKKNALLKRLSRNRNALKMDRETLIAEKKKVTAQIECLEEENHILTDRMKDLKNELANKRKTVNEVFKRSDEVKRRMVRSLSRKQGLLNEIRFFELEKTRLSDAHREISERLGANVYTLEGTIRDIGFVKGEVRMLMEKMKTLEGEVPMKFKDMDNLDEKFSRTLEALTGFYDRIQNVEKAVKEKYYKKKND